MARNSQIASEKDDKKFLEASVLDNSLGYKLRLAQILAYRNFEEQMTDYGVAPRYLGLLAIVAENPSQPQSRLAEAVGLHKSSLVTILDRLEKDGLVERKGSKEDRRSKALLLTKKGGRIVKELLAHATRHDSQMTRGIDQESLDNLLSTLDQIVQNLRNGSEPI